MLTQQIEEKKRRLEELRRRKAEREKNLKKYDHKDGDEYEDKHATKEKIESTNDENKNVANLKKVVTGKDHGLLQFRNDMDSMPIIQASALRNNITIDGCSLDEYVQNLLQSGAKSLQLPLASESDSLLTNSLQHEVSLSNKEKNNDGDDTLIEEKRDTTLLEMENEKITDEDLSTCLIKSITTYNKTCQTEFEVESDIASGKDDLQKEVATGARKDKASSSSLVKRAGKNIEYEEDLDAASNSKDSEEIDEGVQIRDANGIIDKSSSISKIHHHQISDDEKTKIESSETYRHFLLNTSRTIERVLGGKETFDFLVNYADSKMPFGNSLDINVKGGRQSKGVKMKVFGPFTNHKTSFISNISKKKKNDLVDEVIDPERQNQQRSVIDIDWSPHHPELFLVCLKQATQSFPNVQITELSQSVRETNSDQSDVERYVYSYIGNTDSTKIETDGIVEVWSMAMGTSRPEYTFTYESTVLTALFHINNPFLVIGGTISGQIVVWDIRHQHQSQNIENENRDTSDYERTGSYQRFGPSQRSPMHYIDGHVYPVYNISFIRGSTSMDTLVSASTDGRCCFWNLSNLSEPLEIKHFHYSENRQSTNTLFRGPVGWSTIPISNQSSFLNQFSKGSKSMKKTEGKLTNDRINDNSFPIVTMLASTYDTCNLANPHDIEVVLGGQDGSIQVGFLSERKGLMYSSKAAFTENDTNSIEKNKFSSGLSSGESFLNTSASKSLHSTDYGDAGFASYSGEKLAKLITSSHSLFVGSEPTAENFVDGGLPDTTFHGHYGMITSMDRNSYSKYRGSGQRRSNKLHRLVCTSSLDWTIKIWDTYCLFPRHNEEKFSKTNGFENRNFTEERDNVKYYFNNPHSNEQATSLHPIATLLCEDNFDAITVVKWSPHHPSLLAAGSSAGDVFLWNIAISCEEPICAPFQVGGQSNLMKELNANENGDNNNKISTFNTNSNYNDFPSCPITSLKWHPNQANRLIVGDARGSSYVILLDDKYVSIRGNEEAKVVSMMKSRG